MYRLRKKVTSGFTLIELLVVIAIISLLVSILLPSLQRARGLAKTVTCSSNLRNLGLQNQLYTSDNDGELPYCKPLPFWFDVYRQYGDNVGMVNCPENNHLEPYDSCNVYLPSDAPHYVVNIGMNGWLSARYPDAAYKLNDMTSPTETILFGDAYNRQPSKGTAYLQFVDWNIYSLVDWRHNEMERANAVYADGHADAIDESIDNWATSETSRIFWKGK